MKLNIKKNMLTKMIVAGIVGLAVIIIGGVFLATSLKDKPKYIDNGQETTELGQDNEEEITTQIKDKEYVRSLALVKEVSTLSEEIEIVDVDTNVLVTLKITGTTSIEDEYGTVIVLEKIIPGHLINVKYDSKNYQADSVKIAAQIQTIRNIDTFDVNEELKTIQIGSDIFEYDQNVLIKNSEGPIELSQISVADEIIVRAYQSKIWSILVESGHGYLVLKNHEAYIDGRLEIGNRQSYTIVRDMRIPIKAGVQQVVISNDQMTPYSASVFIEEGKEAIIDLGELTPKIAKVRLDIVQTDVSVYIDDEKVENPTEERQLNYGEYSIRVESPGYVPWEGILVVDQAYIVQRIDMEVEPLYIYISGPAGASFYIDNVLKGVLEANKPLGVPVTPGGHTLQLRKTDYNTWERNVFIEDTGEDYYYTVPSMTEIPVVPVPEPEPETNQNNNQTEPNGNQEGGIEVQDPVEDVYGG